MKKLMTLVLSIALVFSLAACSENEETDNTIELGYQSWVDGIAMTHLTAAILQDEMGYDTDITQANLGPIFSDVASGNLDLMMHAWLPNTHADYADQYSEDWERLGTSYEGARIGLVVPQYVDIDSISELNANASEFDSTVVGIESGAGIMQNANTAMDTYDLESNGWDLQASSGPAMVATLGDAIENEEWIVVTGWTPHYKFARYDLKFLDDPENVFGASDNIVSIGRDGFSEDHPDVAQMIDNIYLSDTQFGELAGLIANDDDDTPYIEIARTWMDDNPDVWQDWVPEE